MIIQLGEHHKVRLWFISWRASARWAPARPNSLLQVEWDRDVFFFFSFSFFSFFFFVVVVIIIIMFLGIRFRPACNPNRGNGNGPLFSLCLSLLAMRVSSASCHPIRCRRSYLTRVVVVVVVVATQSVLSISTADCHRYVGNTHTHTKDQSLLSVYVSSNNQRQLEIRKRTAVDKKKGAS